MKKQYIIRIVDITGGCADIAIDSQVGVIKYYSEGLHALGFKFFVYERISNENIVDWQKLKEQSYVAPSYLSDRPESEVVK